MRHEIKFVCEELAHELVLAELRLAPQGLRTVNAPRTVQSVYFDSSESTALHDNLAGLSRRSKLRFRWYGDATRGVLGQLEWKRRAANLSDKLVHPIESALDVEGTSRIAFQRAIWAASPPVWRERGNGKEPVLWVRYARQYFGTPDGALRVTLDRGLAAFDLRFDVALSSRKRQPMPAILIIEVKAAAEQHAAVRDLVRRIEIPASKCSKFVMGRAPSEAPILSRVLG